MSEKWSDLSNLVEALRMAASLRIPEETLYNAREAVNAMLSRGAVERDESQLTKNGACALYHCVIKAFAVGAFRNKTPICGPLVTLLNWFIPKTDDKQRASVWNVLLLSQEFDANKLSVEIFIRNKIPKQKPSKEEEQPSIDLLLGLLSVQNLNGDEIGAIVDLLQLGMKSLEETPNLSFLWNGRPLQIKPKDAAIKALLNSKPLLALFLNPLETNEMSRDESVEMGLVGPRRHPDNLLLDALFFESVVSDDLDSFFRCLCSVYKLNSQSSKSQLLKIIERVFACDSRGALFLSILSDSNNQVLLASSLECLFVSSVCFGESALEKISPFLISCAAKGLARPSLLKECSLFMSADFSESNRSLLIERLDLLSILFSRNVKTTSDDNLYPEFFLRLLDLFVFLENKSDLSEDHQSTNSDTGNDAFDVVSSTQAILIACQDKCTDFSLFSLLLRAANSNFDQMSRFLPLCTPSIIKKWPNHASSEDLSRFLHLYQFSDDDSVMMMTEALKSLLTSPSGIILLADSLIPEEEWMSLFEKLNALVVETDSKAFFLDCFVHIFRALEKNVDLVFRALKTATCHILSIELPNDVLDRLFSLLFRQGFFEDRIDEYFAFLFETLIKLDSWHEITFFGALEAFLSNLSDRRRVCKTLKGITATSFKILSKDNDGKCTRDLINLLKLILKTSKEAKEFKQSENAPFFSARTPKNQSPYRGGTQEDLVNLVEKLGKDQDKCNDVVLRESILDLDATKQGKNLKCEANKPNFIPTQTVRENIRKIEEMICDGHPILLYGSSGVGKTATVTEVACRHKNSLVRINMSSAIISENFLSKLTVSVDDGKTKFSNEIQPFAESFRKGRWVLLDELNLAEENVLKIVTDALETGQITIYDKSSALSPPIRIKQHKDFRLFATMNPWQAGKRERLSDAFLSQFSVMHFKEIPKNEWKLILVAILEPKFKAAPELIDEMAEKMTKSHFEIKSIVEDCSEKGSYAEITNRELLMWTQMVSSKKKFPSDLELGRCAWVIYGCRFKEDGRDKIFEFLKEAKMLLSTPQSRNKNRIERILAVFSQKYEAVEVDNDLQRFWNAHFSDIMSFEDVSIKALSKCVRTHYEVVELVTSAKFIEPHGIYTSIAEARLVKWIRRALEQKVLQKALNEETFQCLGILGAEEYVAVIRHHDAKTQILGIFVAAFGIDSKNFKMGNSVPDMPVALNSELYKSLEIVTEALSRDYPILIEGCSGSYKTCLAKVVAFLSRSNFEQITLTHESEPSALLGETLPSNKTCVGAHAQWKDGPLTRAFINGTVCIVDNIGQAEAVVQERLNPVLESPKFLCLSERGDTDPLACKPIEGIGKNKEIGPAPGFQFIATYTPKGMASSGLDSTSNDLTLSLFNRFVVVHINDPCCKSEEEFKAAVESIIKCCIVKFRSKNTVANTTDCCIRILKSLSRQTEFVCTFRDFVAFIDIFTTLKREFENHSETELLNCCVLATFASRIKNQKDRDAFLSDLNCPLDALECLKLLEDVDLGPSLILTQSRKTHVQFVRLGALSKRPVLLEGKSAIGKTSLIMGLKDFAGPNKRVRILSNSNTTTIQDYFGSWLPSPNGFAYSKGVLVQAMESGDWFISDEFNLAPLPVISSIMPFLEGSHEIEIPGTGIKVNVHPQFRFFATQNPCSGGKSGRNLLPITVRNRFLEVNVEGFPKDEFTDILYERFEKQHPGVLSRSDAESFAKLYFELEGQFVLTMRHLIKIVRRFVLFNDEMKESATWPNFFFSLLNPLASNESESQNLLNSIQGAFGVGSIRNLRMQMVIDIRQERSGVSFHQGPLQVHFRDFELKRSPLWNPDKSAPPSIFQRKLIELAFAIKAKEPVLLYGETGFKTELIKTWLQISRRIDQVETVHLISDSEASELIGHVQLTSLIDVLQLLRSTGLFVLATMKNAAETNWVKNNPGFNARSISTIEQKFDGAIVRLIDALNPKTLVSDSYESEPSTSKSRTISPVEDDITSMSEDSSEDDGFSLGSDEASAESVDCSATIDASTDPQPSFENDKNERKTRPVEDQIHEILRVAEILVKEGVTPKSFRRMLDRLKKIKEFLRFSESNNNRPCFIFRDGPFVRAITLKRIFVVEDYDACPQSVTERLNSALETEPFFSIPEDTSYDGDSVNLEIPTDGYAFVATAHLNTPTGHPRLSDSTRSRLTLIRAPSYSYEEMISVVEKRLKNGLSSDEQGAIPVLIDWISQVRRNVLGSDAFRSTEDFRSILRWVSFIINHPKTLDVKRRCILGAKFFYQSSLPEDYQNDVLRECFDVDPAIFNVPEVLPDRPFEIIVGDDSKPKIQLFGIGLTLESLKDSNLTSIDSESNLQFTKTVHTNIASIFASLCTKSPLLIEGPPGIGKTAIVTEIARLLGTELERINCSSDTAIEQLYGSVMPVYDDQGCRQFEWRDGKMLKAMKEEKWILLDEVNLLPMDVLESLIPLLENSAKADNFAIPGQMNGERLNVEKVQFFATMNPAAEGGGRATLSRSFKNLFALIHLERQKNEELLEISKKLFEKLIESNLFSASHVKTIFDVYTKIEEIVESGKIQDVKTHQKFNLRDLTAVRDIIAGNIKDQLSHYRSMSLDFEKENGSKQSKMEAVIILLIRRALQLVFKHRFDDPEDKAKIQKIIDGVIQNRWTTDALSDKKIDTSVGSLLKIGEIYIDKNPVMSTTGTLVHTNETVAQLELLATAFKSNRTVLLEGGPCSKKTALVKEFAALTGSELFILSLHRDYEVSDLIGQWLPMSTTHENNLHPEYLSDVKLLKKVILEKGLSIVSNCDVQERMRFFQAIQRVLDLEKKELSLDTARETLSELEESMDSLSAFKDPSYTQLQSQLDSLISNVNPCKYKSHDFVFEFVESDLIKALSSGAIVLFDNINAAPPNVIERILSLFEETPFLNLYEHSEGRVMTVGKGGIHPKTRIVATADIKRINTNRLSTPLLNRMIKIWFPEIDADVTEKSLTELEHHEAVVILSKRFSCAGGIVAALMSVLFHARVKKMEWEDKITISKDSRITFRMLQQATSVAIHWMNKGEKLFNSVVWSLWRTYAVVVEKDEDPKNLKLALKWTCKQVNSLSYMKFQEIPKLRENESPFHSERRRIERILASTTQITLKLVLAQILKIDDPSDFKDGMIAFLTFAAKLHLDIEIHRLLAEVDNGLKCRDFLKRCKALHCDQLMEYSKDISKEEGKKMEVIQTKPGEIVDMCRQFIANSTFSDWKQRKAFLEDMVVIERAGCSGREMS